MSWFLLLPLASIAGYVFALARHTSVRWSVAPITVLSAIVLVLFFSDFVSLLRPASLCLTFGGIAMLAVECKQYYQKHGFSFSTAIVRNASLVGLAIFFLIDVNKNAQFVSWDMFSHWGTIIKLMEFANTAIDLNNHGYRLYFQDYPPGAAYVAYYFLRFTGFHENIAIFSHALLLLFIGLPAVAASNTSFRTQGLLVAALTFVLVMLMGQGWSTILIDQIVGALFGVILAIYWVERNEPNRWIALPPVFGFLVLTKDSGASFAVAAIVLILVVHWYRTRRQAVGSFGGTSMWKALALCVLVPMAVSYSWSAHVKSAELGRSLAGISISGMIKQASHCCTTDREHFVLARFSDRMLGIEPEAAGAGKSTGQLIKQVATTHWDAPGKLALALFVVGLLIAALQANSADRRSYALLVLGVSAGGVVYCLLLLLYYLYGFSDAEGRALSSFERYYGSYALGTAFLLLAGLGSLPFSSRTQKISGMILLLALLAPITWLGRSSIQPYLWKGGPEYFPTRDELVRPLVHPFVDEAYPRVSVLVVWQAEKPSVVGLEYWILRYELTPRTPQAGGCFSFGPPLYPGDTITCNWAEDTFKRTLGNNHYVFVGSGLQSLRKAYPSVFDETTATGNSAILKVTQDTPGVIILKKWRGEPR